MSESLNSDMINSKEDTYETQTQTDSINTENSQENILKLKKRADKAFHSGDFKNAYKLYTKTLELEPNNYDLLACQIGTCINLGQINDEVFAKCDFLINLDDKRAQGYYLKAMANDLAFKFDAAIENFFKSLELEKDHSKIIVKNLIKSIGSYLNLNNIDEIMKLNEPELTEMDFLIKLTQLCEDLIKNRKNNIAFQIINYIQLLEIENYFLKTQILYYSGKLHKIEGRISKAIMSFEECLYLGSLNEDNKVRIKAIVSISSCYLEIGDLHKVIYYYHKLIDIEQNLIAQTSQMRDETESSEQFSENLINIELRIAIRQNLFTAHYRLGKLRLCCYYLNDIINIIDKKYSLNLDSLKEEIFYKTLFESFEFVQIKIDATIELIKLLILFDEYTKLFDLLKNMLKFVEIIDESTTNQNLLNAAQSNSLRYFKIKCYSYLGICLAGLRDFRYSKLCTRKALCLIDKEIEAKSSSSEDDIKLLKLLKIECLIDASDSCLNQIKTFKEMIIKSDKITYDLNDQFNKEEKLNLIEMYDKRIEYSKSAYLLSKSFIDPNLRAQTAFNLAKSLYDNEFYQSAAYYFSEVLSISTILLDQQNQNNNFYTDATPDYSIESTIYLSKCQLLSDYFQVESSIYLLPENESINSEVLKLDFESLYLKLNKCKDTLLKRILKWKLHETSRASFLFNVVELENLKEDRESKRLRNITEICTECLAYVCNKLGKITESVLNIEFIALILNSSSLDLIEKKLINKNTEELNRFLYFNDIKEIVQSLNTSTLIYKLIFDKKILLIYYIDKTNGEIIFHDQIKISLKLTDLIDLKCNITKEKLNNSLIDYFYRKFEFIENETVKECLNDIESRDIVLDDKIQNLIKLRDENRNKERRFFEFLNEIKSTEKNDSDLRSLFYMNDLDLFNLKISESFTEYDKLNEEIKQKTKSTQLKISKKENSYRNHLHSKILSFFNMIVIKPIEKFIVNNESIFVETINIVIDSKYSKMFINAFNMFNNENKNFFSSIFIYDSYLHFALNYLTSIEKYAKENENLEEMRKECNKPIRFEPNQDESSSRPKTIKIPKSSITPRLTSNPKLAFDLLNQNSNSDYIILKNDHVDKLKQRLDEATGVLISETITGTNAKKSYLEIIDYKQVHNVYRSCAIGCPEMPRKISLKQNRFLTNGFEQLKQVAKLLNTEPIFSTNFTKPELIVQLETSTIIYLSTYSTNESDSILICSETKEYPSSGTYEFDKYCKFTSKDLDTLDMFRCNLLVLNCYSSINHKPRFDLAKKFISRGCKCVLVVMTPQKDKLITQFYNGFFENLKKLQNVNLSYENLPIELRKSFCLIGSKSIKLSITDISKSMIHSKVDSAFENLTIKNEKDFLNPQQEISILSLNYLTSLERTLGQLQLLTKFLLNQLIEDVGLSRLKKSCTVKKTILFLNDLVSKSIFYMKTKKDAPEASNDLIDENLNAINLLKCLGFSVQRMNTTKIRDQKDKYVIMFPDQRYLDLNLRMTHVFSSLIELCFNKSRISNGFDLNSEIGYEDDELINEELSQEDSNNSFSNNIIEDEIDKKFKSIIFNLQSLLPIMDKNLLAYLIDILAFTKFSPEISLSITDNSIYYSLNFYEAQSSNLKNKTYSNLIEKNVDKWKLDQDLLEKSPLINPSNFAVKYGINNKVVNFLLSIGFEIIGTWLRFNDIDLNRKIIDSMLKFLTSFTPDRDMSLYKELNINVLGQRYSARSLSRTMSNLNKDNLTRKDGAKNGIHDLLVTKPWCTLVESTEMMEKKIHFVEKYLNLNKKIEKEREETLRHHLNYLTRQFELNIDYNEEQGEKMVNEKENDDLLLNKQTIILEKRNNEANSYSELKKRIKYKKGGGPSRDRVIVNEKYDLDLKQINHLRHYSHYFCERNLQKLDAEKKSKVQNLILPLIKSLNNQKN